LDKQDLGSSYKLCRYNRPIGGVGYSTIAWPNLSPDPLILWEMISTLRPTDLGSSNWNDHRGIRTGKYPGWWL